MCGICGVFDFGGHEVDRDILLKMAAALRHRGPDSEGFLVDGEVALGHRRLSIIDVAGGAQPVSNERGDVHVVFNGEIYNFVELRDELEALGHRFNTRSDTEVIVHAYEEWSDECVLHFNGMFAFAVWDSRTREVLLARDHLGIKPLYYTTLGSRVLFASEVKALLQDPACPREVDTQALAELFTYRYVPSPNTLFEGIKKLPPGHTMRVSKAGANVRRYWNTRPDSTSFVGEADAIEKYQELLEDAVKLQMRSDVPLGLFLSSGVDSGALLAIMSAHAVTPVKTFTIGFEGGDHTNELREAGELALMFGAAHETWTITADDYRKYYERYMWDLEEPVGNETAAAFYFVSKMARRQVTVALSGQGADEQWAGYHRHLGARVSAGYSRLPSGFTQRVGQWVTKIPGRNEKLRRASAALGEHDVLTRFVKMYSFFSADMKEQLFTGPLAASTADPAQALRSLQRDVADADPLAQMLYIDTRSNLPDDLLMVGDKMSMANSLEARVPFLDVRLVELVERLPSEMKIRWLTGKYLHKRALQKWLPKKVVWRKKKGFANPIEEWFRVGMRAFVEELLLSPDSAVARFFDQKYIRTLLRRDREGKEQLRRHIYLLVSFELWHRAFIKP